MKTLGTLSDKETCSMIYDLHTISPIFQSEKERQRRILDANYSKVDIDNMVNGLDIEKASKTKLKQTLNEFPTLFRGGLGLLDIRPVEVELQTGSKPYDNDNDNDDDDDDKVESELLLVDGNKDCFCFCRFCFCLRFLSLL